MNELNKIADLIADLCELWQEYWIGVLDAPINFTRNLWDIS